MTGSVHVFGTLVQSECRSRVETVYTAHTSLRVRQRVSPELLVSGRGSGAVRHHARRTPTLSTARIGDAPVHAYDSADDREVWAAETTVV